MMRSKLRYFLLVFGAVVLLLSALGQGTVKTVIIDSIEDTYVVTNLADPENLQGLQGNNYGNLDFLKTWYAFGVVGDERIISVDLVKFDLDEIKDKEIESAFIQLFARQADLTDNIRLVDVHLVRDPWSEAGVTYDTRPAWDRTPIATTAIYGGGGVDLTGWRCWDGRGDFCPGHGGANKNCVPG